MEHPRTIAGWDYRPTKGWIRNHYTVGKVFNKEKGIWE